MVKYIFLLPLLISIKVIAAVMPLADPTQPLHYTSDSVDKSYQSVLPTLQSILREGAQQSAIINNKLHITGQSVNGYLITRIKEDAVFLYYKNKTYKLTLYTPEEHFIK